MKTDIKELEKRYAGVSDDENPLYVFGTTSNAVLIEIAKGNVDPLFLAQRELANRGRDTDGEWVGYEGGSLRTKLEHQIYNLHAKLKETEFGDHIVDRETLEAKIAKMNLASLEAVKRAYEGMLETE